MFSPEIQSRMIALRDSYAPDTIGHEIINEYLENQTNLQWLVRYIPSYCVGYDNGKGIYIAINQYDLNDRIEDANVFDVCAKAYLSHYPQA